MASRGAPRIPGRHENPLRHGDAGRRRRPFDRAAFPSDRPVSRRALHHRRRSRCRALVRGRAGPRAAHQPAQAALVDALADALSRRGVAALGHGGRSARFGARLSAVDARSARRRQGRWRPEHRVRQLARIFGLDPPPSPRLSLAPRREADAAKLVPLGGPVLAIGPAANWRGKEWRAERFAELAQRLTAPGGLFPGARVAVLAAAHERKQAQPLIEALPAQRCIDLVGKVDLLTAAAVLRRCALFIGNDTGLMHLAAAAGVPTLGLFGPSPIELYAPWGSHTATVATAIAVSRSLRSGFRSLHDRHFDGQPQRRCGRRGGAAPLGARLRRGGLMAAVVMTDDGIAFDGTTPTRAPLGGAEAAFLTLAEALRGARPSRASCATVALRRSRIDGVDWAPLDKAAARALRSLHRQSRPSPHRARFAETPPAVLDSQSRNLSAQIPLCRATVAASAGDRHLRRAITRATRAVVDAERRARHHPLRASTEAFRHAAPLAVPPPPRAIFTSNPLRGLDWLLDLWERAHPSRAAAGGTPSLLRPIGLWRDRRRARPMR